MPRKVVALGSTTRRVDWRCAEDSVRARFGRTQPSAMRQRSPSPTVELPLESNRTVMLTRAGITTNCSCRRGDAKWRRVLLKTAWPQPGGDLFVYRSRRC